ncbi:MAG: DUF4416 family protein [Thermodesulfobacteriota bacterium]|nr:DUF4416 family protein [Thermodesulfobacteriota bacterium]
MSVPREPLPAKLFLSILSAGWDAFWPGLLKELNQAFGKADYVSEPIAFDQTSYYDKELGTPITRRVLGFEELKPQDRLPEIKLATNALEEKYAHENKRIFNLDPGFITLERLVLATGKDFTHRIYLGRGIRADLTLIFTGKGWQKLPWTFPDYAGPELQAHLTRLRDAYKQEITRVRGK